MSIFAQIIARQVPSEIVWESEHAIAIRDLHPIAPVHLLLIPKKGYSDFHSIPPDELDILAHLAKAAHELAERFEVREGYRLVTNVGPNAGQSVFHLHFHLIGGKKLGEMG